MASSILIDSVNGKSVEMSSTKMTTKKNYKSTADSLIIIRLAALDRFVQSTDLACIPLQPLIIDL